jgi:ABC-type amino acid transport system permease subunit
VDPTLVVSLAFLVSPLMGYVIVILPMTTRQKLVVAIVALVLLISVPLLVLWLAGGSGSGSVGMVSSFAVRAGSSQISICSSPSPLLSII